LSPGLFAAKSRIATGNANLFGEEGVGGILWRGQYNRNVDNHVSEDGKVDCVLQQRAAAQLSLVLTPNDVFHGRTVDRPLLPYSLKL